MLGRKRNISEPSGFFYGLSTAILVLGWGLVIAGAVFVAFQAIPIVREWQNMFDEGYGIIHGEWVSPESYEFIKPFIGR